VQIQLGELLAVSKGTADQMLAVDELSKAEFRCLHARYLALARGEPSATPEVDTSLSKEAPIMKSVRLLLLALIGVLSAARPLRRRGHRSRDQPLHDPQSPHRTR
jgi:hypothetical protein